MLSFLVPCPFCGNRSVYEFRFGGEVKPRPEPDAPPEVWRKYVSENTNAAGVQTEWWFHRAGCRQWLQAKRDTVANRVIESWFPAEDNQ